MSFEFMQKSLFVSLLFLVTVIFLWLIRDFIFPIFWAIVFTILFAPLQRWWLRNTKSRKSLSAILTIFTILIIVIVPVAFIGSMVLEQSVDYYSQVNQQVPALLDKLPGLFVYLEPLGVEKAEVRDTIGKIVNVAGTWLGEQALAFGQNAFKATMLFFVMLYVLFFTLRDGKHIQERLIKILPLGDAKERRLFQRFTSTTRATVKGTFIIAIIQGIAGGLLFALLGIDGAVLWGTVMALLSVIPAVGPAVVWVPAAIILFLNGAIVQAIIMVVVGAVIIGLVDNLLRPPLVGRDSQMPDVMILLSTLGGLTAFGITGFVIGPVIAAFFLSMWKMFEEEYRDQLETYG